MKNKIAIEVEVLPGDRAWNDGTEATNSFICYFYLYFRWVRLRFYSISIHLLAYEFHVMRQEGIIYSENMKICWADWRKCVCFQINTNENDFASDEWYWYWINQLSYIAPLLTRLRHSVPSASRNYNKAVCASDERYNDITTIALISKSNNKYIDRAISICFSFVFCFQVSTTPHMSHYIHLNVIGE